MFRWINRNTYFCSIFHSRRHHRSEAALVEVLAVYHTTSVHSVPNVRRRQVNRDAAAIASNQPGLIAIPVVILMQPTIQLNHQHRNPHRCQPLQFQQTP